VKCAKKVLLRLVSSGHFGLAVHDPRKSICSPMKMAGRGDHGRNEVGGGVAAQSFID